jgi:chemotaxis protein CheZ
MAEQMSQLTQQQAAQDAELREVQEAEAHALRLAAARDLVIALEANDEVGVEQCLRSLDVDSKLYRQVGMIAREVHQKMVEFLSGSGLMEMAQGETADTRMRLQHVIELTDNAAHETLSSAERIRELVNTLNEALEALPAGAEAGIPACREHLAELRAEVSRIVLAQGYQDLSGQIIGRAIALVADIEARLIDLLTIAGMEQRGAQAVVPGTEHGEGPRVAGTANNDSLADQDAVDDLLTSLGF